MKLIQVGGLHLQYANFEANTGAPQEHYNAIGYRCGIAVISGSNGRSGDIRRVIAIDMPHLQRHAAIAVAATAQVRFVRRAAIWKRRSESLESAHVGG